MHEQENLELVKQGYDAYAKGDLSRLLAIMSPDIEWDIPVIPGVPFTGMRHGRDQVAAFFREVAESQQLRAFHIGEMIAQGDRVVVTGHHDWTVNKNGADFGTDWVEIFTVRNGQLVSFTELLDTCAVANAYREQVTSALDPGAMPSAQCPSIH
ncbi:MAG TPA: nuclear transport factor 2 family protein [Telluria sp.]